MDLNALNARLESFSQSLTRGEHQLLTARLAALISVFPFNEYEYSLMFLMNRQVITFDEYESLRAEYVSANKYLNLYELAPRVFGEIWGHAHIIDLDSRFQRASKTFDPDYSGEYDLWIEGVRVEVKAARAINTRQRGSLVSKALRFGSSGPFWMNYQQIKLDVCDGFIFIGVWVDRIHYWVFSNQEVTSSPYLSHQHRGGVEYQIGITGRNINDFDPYLVDPSEIAQKILDKGHR
jgi:hypothetical protein